ncbi:Mitochondrial glycoprotein [Carex littledalei]|uniref:Mitochondrial glycoprotein n=1 Tax=Carex littledalei TaxID=544730 RepID=A0A833VGG6_9POAL|nr:Mitochondrial glycoprotein [Carex littledalei]
MARQACRSLLSRIQTRISSPPQTRSLITGMRRSALKETLLRALRSEISYESSHLPTSPLETHFNSFTIDPREGEQWVSLTRSDDREEIKIDATLFDGSAPETRSGDVSDGSNQRLHITLAVEVSKKDSDSEPESESGGIIMQFLCSAWPDAMDVDRVYAGPRGIYAIKPYMGPEFKDLDEEVQKAVQDYLEQRGVNDELAAFLHKYAANKDRTEHVRWLQNIESYMKK